MKHGRDHSETIVRIVATPDGAPTETALEETQRAAPGHSQAQVQIHAAGLNPADLHMLADSRPRQQAQPMGFEGAGVVVAVGPGASTPDRPMKVGDEVIVYLMLGSFASRINALAADVFAKPANLSFPAWPIFSWLG